MNYNNFIKYFNKFIKDYRPYSDSDFHKTLVTFLRDSYFNDAYVNIPEDLRSFLDQQIIPDSLYDTILQSIGYPSDILELASIKQKNLLLKELSSYNKYKGSKYLIKQVFSTFNYKANIYELLLNYKDEQWLFYPYPIYKDPYLSLNTTPVRFSYVSKYVPRFLINEEDLDIDNLVLPIKSNIILIDSSDIESNSLLSTLFFTITAAYFKDDSFTLYLFDQDFSNISVTEFLSVWLYLLMRKNQGSISSFSVDELLVFDFTNIPEEYSDITIIDTLKEEYDNISNRNDLDEFYNNLSDNFKQINQSYESVLIENLESHLLFLPNVVPLFNYINTRIENSNLASKIEFILDEMRSSFITWITNSDLTYLSEYSNYILSFLDSTYTNALTPSSFIYKLVELFKPLHVDIIARYKIVIQDKFNQVFMDDSATLTCNINQTDSYDDLDDDYIRSASLLPSSSSALMADSFLAAEAFSGSYTFDDTKIVLTDDDGLTHFEEGDFIFSPGTETYKATEIVLKDTSSFTLASKHNGQTGLFDKAWKYYLPNQYQFSDLPYGINWNESTDAYTRSGALTSFDVGSSPGDSYLSIQRLVKRCVLLDSGSVNYYLLPIDSTKKLDGSSSVLTGADGQVMVEIPLFYYKYSYAANVHSWSISFRPHDGYQPHPAFFKDGVWVSHRYIGAYEAILYDVSASIYANGIYQTAVSCVFANADSSLTIASRTAVFSKLAVGDKITVSGTSSNNGTFTVASLVSATKITVSEAVTNETAANTVIQTQKDWTATTGDKLSSVSGKTAINYGTRANFRAAAKNRGTGWRQLDYDLLSAVQLLYLTEYASFYSQSTIGNGLTDWSGGVWSSHNDYNPINFTGLSNSNGNAVANVSGGDGVVGSYMSYRGIENFFGHMWKWCDGINVNNNVPYVTNNVNNFADDTTTNYTNLGVTLPSDDGYQNLLQQISRGFLPISLGATSTTKITDYYYQSTGWRVVYVGGSAYSALLAGMFCLGINAASSGVTSIARTFGGRVCF